MKKKLLVAGLALGMSSSAWALNIDFTGSGNIAGSQFFSQVGWESGNAIIADVVDAGLGEETSATVYAQASFSFGTGVNDVMSYQMILPVIATRVTGTLGPDSFVSTTFVIDTTRTSSFALFLDPTPANSDSTGLGFGNLNGGALDTDQVLIASGVIESIDVSGFAAQTNLTKTTTTAIDSVDGIVNGVAVTSQQITGSTSLKIDITSKNDLYVVSTLDALSVDMTLQDLAFNAPFPNIEASDSVVNYSAFYGTNNLNSLQDCAPLAGPPADLTCDVQLQTGSNSQFFDPRVPEPASLALTGLGLGLLGFLGRRRKKA